MGWPDSQSGCGRSFRPARFADLLAGPKSEPDWRTGAICRWMGGAHEEALRHLASRD